MQRSPAVQQSTACIRYHNLEEGKYTVRLFDLPSQKWKEARAAFLARTLACAHTSTQASARTRARPHSAGCDGSACKTGMGGIHPAYFVHMRMVYAACAPYARHMLPAGDG